jgi:hypothetical protein
MPLPERSSINFGPNAKTEEYRTPVSLPELFAQFDRGIIPIGQFVAGVQLLGFELTADFERLVSGNCTFTLVEAVRALKKSEKENVAAAVVRTDRAGDGGRTRGNLSLGNLTSSTVSAQTSVFDAIASLAKGSIDAEDFRKFLAIKKVGLSSEMDRVLRLHESDNSQTFQDFAKVLKRQGVDVGRPVTEESEASSRPQTPPVYCGESERTTEVQRPSHPTRGLKNFGNHGNFISWK